MHTPNVKRNQYSNAAVPHTSPSQPFFTRAPPCVTLRRGLRHSAGKEGGTTVYLDPGKVTLIWVLAEFRHPTHQMSFHTLRALSCLKFIKSELIYDN